MVAEVFGEFQKLLGVAGQPRELGKDEAGDVAAFDVGKHPLGFGMFLDGFAGDAGKVIHLLDRPAAGVGVCLGAFKVVRGAFALGLIFTGNPNPDADVFVQDTIFLHILLHTRKRITIARKKYVFSLIVVLTSHRATKETRQRGRFGRTGKGGAEAGTFDQSGSRQTIARHQGHDSPGRGICGHEPHQTADQDD